jgi:hypothetical protein
MLRFSWAVLIGVMMSTSAQAQSFTTAAEVKPILTATKPSWIAVREYDGRDLVYFTNLLAWRCGVSDITYTVNGGAATPLEMEPCHEDTAQPNALLMETVLPYVTLPLSSVEKVGVTVTFDDGSTEVGDYERKAVLMP